MKNYKIIFPVILQKIGTIIVWPVLKFFVRLEISGAERIRGAKSPLIITANHTSELDVVALVLILPFISQFRPIFFVANSEEKFKTFGWRSYFYGGAFFNMLGAYSIVSGHRNYAYALQNHIALLRKGRTILIFPEGKRTTNGRLSPAHGGVAYLAHTMQANVLPVAVDTFFGLTWREFFLRRRTVRLAIGAPIGAKDIVSVANPSVEDFKRGGEIVMTRIGSLLYQGRSLISPSPARRTV